MDCDDFDSAEAGPVSAPPAPATYHARLHREAPPRRPPGRQRTLRETEEEIAEQREEGRAIKLRTARVSLDCDWPERLPPGALRGAVVSAIDRIVGGDGCQGDPLGWRAHIDWHGHTGAAQGEKTRHGPPPICYRKEDGRPAVYFWYPEGDAERLTDRLREMAQIGALTTRAGRVIPVRSVRHHVASDTAWISRRRFWLYRMRTTFFPSVVAACRRPRVHAPIPERDGHPGILAWVNGVLAQAMTDRIMHLGWGGDAPVRIQVLEHRSSEVRWNKEGGAIEEGIGFYATFTSNAHLPDGMALGRHASCGFGELRRMEEVGYKVQR